MMYRRRCLKRAGQTLENIIIEWQGGDEGNGEDVAEDRRSIRKKEERENKKKKKKKEQKCPVCVKIRQGVLMCMCVGSRYSGRQLQGRELGGRARV